MHSPLANAGEELHTSAVNPTPTTKAKGLRNVVRRADLQSPDDGAGQRPPEPATSRYRKPIIGAMRFSRLFNYVQVVVAIATKMSLNDHARVAGAVFSRSR